VKRFILLTIILLPFVTAAAAPQGDAEEEAARIMQSTAETFRGMFTAMDEQTLRPFAGMSAGGEFEEMEVLGRLARSEQGREVVGALCRRAMEGDDPYLKLVAFNFLSDTEEPEEAAAYLPALYESISDDDVYALATVAGAAFYQAPEERPSPGVGELYDRLGRDLQSEDKAARLKAAKFLALSMVPSERARALVALGMQSPDADVRRLCVMNLAYAYDGLAESPADYDAVEAALRDVDASVRGFAARRLGTTGDADFVPALLALLDDKEVSVRRAAAGSISSLLSYAPTADKDVSKKLLKRLKGEGDGVTRCRLAEAYGAASVDKEGWAKSLTDDGYWAFFTGQWREKDLDGYYTESDSGGWGGG